MNSPYEYTATFDLPACIRKGLATGAFTLFGGVVRASKTGEIVKHLQLKQTEIRSSQSVQASAAIHSQSDVASLPLLRPSTLPMAYKSRVASPSSLVVVTVLGLGALAIAGGAYLWWKSQPSQKLRTAMKDLDSVLQLYLCQLRNKRVNPAALDKCIERSGTVVAILQRPGLPLNMGKLPETQSERCRVLLDSLRSFNTELLRERGMRMLIPAAAAPGNELLNLLTELNGHLRLQKSVFTAPPSRHSSTDQCKPGTSA